MRDLMQLVPEHRPAIERINAVLQEAGRLTSEEITQVYADIAEVEAAGGDPAALLELAHQLETSPCAPFADAASVLSRLYQLEGAMQQLEAWRKALESPIGEADL